MKKERKPLQKNQLGQIIMNIKNIQIALNNQQDSYSNPQLNEVLHLQYYGLWNIDNLSKFSNLITLYLNNNTIQKIQNISHLVNLVFLNLANNRIGKIQNLQTLTKLKILDLSHNKISKIQNLTSLNILETLNLNGNLLRQIENMNELRQLKSITSLDLSINQIQPKIQFYDILCQMSHLTVLYMRGNTFARGIKNYRKQTILNLKKLLYLDDRPVTPEERKIIQAWKQGGVPFQNQARKHIFNIKQQKQHKQYQQMQSRVNKASQLREQLFQKLTKAQHQQLQAKLQLKKDRNHFNNEQYDTLCLEIKELQYYLQLMRQQTDSMDVGQKPQIKMLIEKDTPEAIYVYNIREQDLQKVKQKFFKEELRPIIAVNYEQKHEQRWVSQYNDILNQLTKNQQGKQHRIQALFNMKVHDYDVKEKRKPRRFTIKEIMEKRKEIKEDNSLQEID